MRPPIYIPIEVAVGDGRDVWMAAVLRAQEVPAGAHAQQRTAQAQTVSAGWGALSMPARWLASDVGDLWLSEDMPIGRLGRGACVWTGEPAFGQGSLRLDRGACVWTGEPRFGQGSLHLDRKACVWTVHLALGGLPTELRTCMLVQELTSVCTAQGRLARLPRHTMHKYICMHSVYANCIKKCA